MLHDFLVTVEALFLTGHLVLVHNESI